MLSRVCIGKGVWGGDMLCDYCVVQQIYVECISMSRRVRPDWVAPPVRTRWTGSSDYRRIEAFRGID